MLRVHVHGAGGKMGRVVCAGLVGVPDLVLVGTSGRNDDLASSLAATRPDVVVEFTTGEVAAAAIATALRAGSHVVSGTTGIAAERVHELAALALEVERGCILAANFALGVVIVQRCAELAARHFPASEILELHHDQKRDAPSGTALATARRSGAARDAAGLAAPQALDEAILRPGARGGREAGIPIHSIRLPGLVAHQEVLFGGTGQVLTLRHDAFDRSAYLPGILLAIRGVTRRKGLLDSIEPLLDDVPQCR